MKNRKIIFGLFILTIIFLVSCKKSDTELTLQTYRYDCSLKRPIYEKGVLVKETLPILNKLCLTEKPSLDNPFTVKYIFKYDRLYFDRPNEQRVANATIYLHDGLSLVEGNLKWKGTLTEKQEQSIEVKVKASDIGKYRIGASIYVEGVGGIGDYFVLNITTNEIIVTDQP